MRRSDIEGGVGLLSAAQVLTTISMLLLLFCCTTRSSSSSDAVSSTDTEYYYSSSNNYPYNDDINVGEEASGAGEFFMENLVSQRLLAQGQGKKFVYQAVGQANTGVCAKQECDKQANLYMPPCYTENRCRH